MQTARLRLTNLYRQLLPSPPSSTSLRRSETWSTSLQRPIDPSQNASRPTSTSSGGSSSSGGSLGALQRSLSEVFGTNKIVIDVPEEARHGAPEMTVRQSPPLSTTTSSFSSLKITSAPSDVSKETTSLTTDPGHHHHHTHHSRPPLRRQTSLAAVPETDPPREVLQSSVHPGGVESGLTKARFSMPGRAASVDENQNVVERGNYDDAIKKAAAEMTSHDHVMKAPEAVLSRPSRRFGIMEILGAGEKKNVRKRDINMMTPQSW